MQYKATLVWARFGDLETPNWDATINMDVTNSQVPNVLQQRLDISRQRVTPKSPGGKISGDRASTLPFQIPAG